MKRVSFLTGLIAFLLYIFTSLTPAHALPRSFLIPHWMHATCETYKCGSYPYLNAYTCYNDTCGVAWAPVDGVSSYYFKSSTWANSGTFPPSVLERGLGGGSGTLGDCTYYWLCAPPFTCDGVKLPCWQDQPNYAVYAQFDTACNSDFDCPTGFMCQQHVCVPKPSKNSLVNKNNRFGMGNVVSPVVCPVHAGLGNYIFSKHLFGFPGKGLPFAFELNYNSLDNTYSGPLGYGWTHTYNVVLTVPTPPSTDVTIKWGDGHEDTFHGDGADNFTPINCTTSVTLTMPDSSHYLATLQNKNTYQFDSSGRLLSIADLNGNQIVLTYSTTTPNQIDHITETAGRQIAFTYNVSGRITAITSPLKSGNTVAFQYDGAGNLTGIVDPRGKTWGFTYDGSHRILTHIDAKGTTVVTNAYDTQGRVSQQTDGANHITTFAYTVDASGTTTVVTPPSGNAITQTYDLAYNLTGAIDGEGNKSNLYNDSQGRLYNATDKNGGMVQVTYDANNNLDFAQDRTAAVSRFTYNSQNRPTSVIDPLGQTISFSYDTNGNLTGFTNPNGASMGITVDSSGLPTQITDFLGKNWNFAYDGSGLPQTNSDSTGSQIGFTYDAVGRLAQVSLPISGVTVQTTYDEAGNALTRTDPLGYVTSFTYDNNGNIATRTFVPTGATTTYTYDWAERPLTVTDALGGQITYTYDVDGNLVSVTDPDGISITRQYNRANRFTAAVDALGHHVYYGYDANGNVTSVKNEIGNIWSTIFDGEGRPLQSSDPLGNKQTTAYDAAGKVASITDPLNNTTTYQYDAADRLVSTTLPDQGVINYTNNPNGSVTAIADPLGHTWSFSYDDAGRLSAKTDPNGKSEIYLMDAIGRITQKTQRDGTVIAYTYDPDSRLTNVTLPGPTTITYGYDAAGNLISVVDPSGTTTMTYDKLGRRLTRTDPGGKTVAFTYTAAGRLATMTYPGNNVLTYTYDTVGRLSTLTDWKGNQTTFQYDSVNRVTQINLPNGTRMLYTYDAAGRVATRSNQKADSTVIASYTYAYDPAGHITLVQRSEPTTPTFFNSNATYSYDPVNRVLTANVDSVSTTYTFDARGNLTSKTAGSTTTTYTYDALNRLSSVSDGTNTTNYTYDASGNRLGKTFNSATTGYVREGGTIYCILDGSGNVQSYNIYAGSLLYSLDGAGAVKVYHGDERGSVVAVTDASQAIVQSYSYGPYGKVVGSSGGLTNAFQYVGIYGVMADENGLYHMQARYYDPDAKRFITEDPLGLSAGLNLYGYVGGDPINHTDPAGLDGTVRILNEWTDIPHLPTQEARDQYIAELKVQYAAELAEQQAQREAYQAAHQAFLQTPKGQLWQLKYNMRAGGGYPQIFSTTGTNQNAIYEELHPELESMNTFQKIKFGFKNGPVYNPYPRAENLNPEWPNTSISVSGPAPPGLIQRTLTNWRTYVTGIPATLALKRAIIRAGITMTAETLTADVATLSTGTVAMPVVVSAGGGWFLGRVIGEDVQVYDYSRHKWVSVDQLTQDLFAPITDTSSLNYDPTNEATKSVRDFCKQHGFNYLDALNKKPGSW